MIMITKIRKKKVFFNNRGLIIIHKVMMKMRLMIFMIIKNTLKMKKIMTNMMKKKMII